MNEQVKKYPKVIHNVLIDLPDKNELKQIAGNFPVFLSSRFTDMEDIREGVAKKFKEF